MARSIEASSVSKLSTQSESSTQYPCTEEHNEQDVEGPYGQLMLASFNNMPTMTLLNGKQHRCRNTGAEATTTATYRQLWDPSGPQPARLLACGVQLVMRAKVDLGMLVLMSAVLIPLDIHVKDWLLSQKAVAVLVIAMSIFIGFRNTQAISRWWEARKLLGTI